MKLYTYILREDYFNQLYFNLHLMTTWSSQAKMKFARISKYQSESV